MPFVKSDLRWLLLFLLLLLSTACSTPAERNDAQAAQQGFSQQVVTGTGFSHRVYFNNKSLGPSIENAVPVTWHIYIEGDGKPWADRHVVANDPTSNDPLMLQLMAQDTQPALYLGRPCYHGMRDDPACNPWLWTYGRYSQTVVESMRAALLTLIDKYKISSLLLIGHSGGGTLAMLLAEHMPQTRAVVTLAGNMDIEAWTAKHGYTPLVGSLNPVLRPPLAAHIAQLHYVGENDRNVPPAMLKGALKNRHNATLIVLDDVAHRQGWKKEFTHILITMKSLGGDNE